MPYVLTDLFIYNLLKKWPTPLYDTNIFLSLAYHFSLCFCFVWFSFCDDH